MFLHTFVSSIPFSKNQSNVRKQKALDKLRGFLQRNSDELTKDEACVPFFAFSFVQYPTTNPVFKKVFTVSN